jgi:hypothetical protein
VIFELEGRMTTAIVRDRGADGSVFVELGWTTEAPSKPGIYAWTENGRFEIWELKPRFDGQLIAWDTRPIRGAQPASYSPVSQCGGEWFGPLPNSNGPRW